ncbi:unnamed protein product [Nippostrongylus brasiliensis]|uniref:E3 ubiquitin-protein ligase n=1 Tax=Nippostrongylus brasiliensis TaxID=27835 RepID=A0A0N4YTX1_NIPBR|nr:unnamed protein product [Nippostrongylus brasiliensis]
MKRLMEKEGLTQKDIDSIDTSQQDVRLYECPICGELDTPSTLRNPLGMLVRVCNNGLCDNLVPSDEPDLPLLDMDKPQGQVVMRNFIRNWKSARNELVRRTLFYSDIISISTSVELKTCGHTVHLKCFNAYRETLRTLFYSDIISISTSVELKTCGHTVHLKCFNAYRETLRERQMPRNHIEDYTRLDENAIVAQYQSIMQIMRSNYPFNFLFNDQRLHESRRSSRDVLCFLCRFNVNALLPLRIDWGFETANRPHIAENNTKAFESLRDCIFNWRRIPQTSDEYRLYSEHFTENIYDLMDSRFWNKFDNESATMFQVQTQLVALIK